jgi:hypothetical protein
MEKFKKLIEALETLDLLRNLLSSESPKCIECIEIREPLEEAAIKITKIYKELCQVQKDEPQDKSSLN